MKNWYLATYKKADGTDSDALILCDSEEQAEEHFICQPSASPPRTRSTAIAAGTVLLPNCKMGLQAPKTKNAAVLQEHFDLQSCGGFE